MALTREERQAIETLIKKVRALESKVEILERLTTAMQKMLERIGAEDNMAYWSEEQWKDFLRKFIVDYMTKNSSINKHNHTNDQQGGDCFAKLGANLIE